MACKIRLILDALSDGKWHTIAELTENLRLAVYEIEARLAFLNRFELTEIDVKDKRVKINKDFRRLSEPPNI